MTAGADFWNERYSGSELVWSAEPNAWFADIAVDLPAGTALDLGAGEARNALWLAQRGWQATAVDFSDVAMSRAAELAAQQLGADAGRLRTVVADITTYDAPMTYDLVLLAYIHLGADERWRMFHAAADAVAPGGLLVVIAHDSSNLTDGVGGPQDPGVLYSPDDVLECLDGEGFEVVRAERARRAVTVDGRDHEAIDAIVVLRRP